MAHDEVVNSLVVPALERIRAEKTTARPDGSLVNAAVLRVAIDLSTIPAKLFPRTRKTDRDDWDFFTRLCEIFEDIPSMDWQYGRLWPCGMTRLEQLSKPGEITEAFRKKHGTGYFFGKEEDQRWTFRANVKREWARILHAYSDKLRQCEELLAQWAESGKKQTRSDASKKRKRKSLQTKPLTEKQAEAVHIVAECKGDISAAATRLGRDRATVKQHYDAAMRKMGKTVVKRATRPLSKDRRGQEAVTEDRRRS